MLPTYIDIEASVAAMGPHQGCFLFGVPAMKGVEDLKRYERIINATDPDLIIQTGTAFGGSAMWFAKNFWMGTRGGPDVITVDIDFDRIDHAVINEQKIVCITGSSIDHRNVDMIVSMTSVYHRVMVILDSDHSSAHVKQEIDVYGPLVSKGCYMVVEDGIYDFAEDGPFKPGPFDAINSRLVNNPTWERDIGIERIEPISMYPAGWWRKR